MLNYRILEIQGVESQDKRCFIEDLTMRDADFLVDELRPRFASAVLRTRPPGSRPVSSLRSEAVVDRVDFGVDTTIEIECPDCFALQEVELPFDRSFFMPGKERTKRRRARSSSSRG